MKVVGGEVQGREGTSDCDNKLTGNLEKKEGERRDTHVNILST